MTPIEWLALILVLTILGLWAYCSIDNDKYRKYDRNWKKNFKPYDNTKPRPHDWLDELLGVPKPEEEGLPVDRESEEDEIMNNPNVRKVSLTEAYDLESKNPGLGEFQRAKDGPPGTGKSRDIAEAKVRSARESEDERNEKAE